MTKHRYFSYGLAFRSELDLAPFDILDQDAGCYDVEIVEEPIRWDAPPESESTSCYDVTPERILINMPGVARYRIAGGSRISVERYDGAETPDVRIFLISSAIGALLHQRETLVLHGSGVVVDGRGVVFVGQSGAGKSTTAALLNSHGFPLICDDLCVIREPVGSKPVVIPGHNSCKLWEDSADALNVDDNLRTRIRKGNDKFFIPPSGGAFSTPVLLGRIVVLTPVARGKPVRLVPLRGSDAMNQLMENVFRPLWVRKLNKTGANFLAVAAIAAKVPVLALERPDAPLNPEAMSRLAHLLSDPVAAQVAM